jgi:hypothetical protein
MPWANERLAEEVNHPSEITKKEDDRVKAKAEATTMTNDDIHFEGLSKEQSKSLWDSACSNIAVIFCFALVGSIGLSFLVGPWAIGCFIWIMLDGFAKAMSKLNEEVQHKQLLNK